MSNYPAEHYMLVLWNHGAGWDYANLYQGDVFSGAAPPITRKKKPLASTRGGGRALRLAHVRAGLSRTRRALFSTTVEKAVKTRGIAFDDQAQDFLDNIELKRVLLEIKKMLKRKIDILGMDACLMSMLEVAYQIKDSSDYQVGSEESEPGEGWPYDRVLKLLAAKPSMSSSQLAAMWSTNISLLTVTMKTYHTVGAQSRRVGATGSGSRRSGKGPEGSAWRFNGTNWNHDGPSTSARV